jgi:hypothetical protein
LNLILYASVLLAGQAAANCSCQMLSDVARKFIAFVKAPSATFKRTTSVKYIENYKNVDIFRGMYLKIINITHTRTLLNGPGCRICVEVIASNNKPGYQLTTQVFINTDGAENKVETIITSSKLNSNS